MYLARVLSAITPWRRTRDFVLGFVVQGTSYLNLTFNYRAIAHERYDVIVLSDALAVLIAFYIIKRIASKDNNTWWLVGQTAGGSLAGVVGTWLTRSWG